MINIDKKYLPVGTVVSLKGGKKKIIIIGFRTYATKSPKKEVENKVWDYCGCMYPEGLISSEAFFVFNHDQIDEIYHLGYIDEEEIEFNSMLNEIE